MARTKHTAQVVGAMTHKVAMKHAHKQPRKRFAQKAARKTPLVVTKRPVRFRPGTVALR